jgi:uncharacterized membrane protein
MRRGKKELSKFLLMRGLWLVLLEVTIVSFGWFFAGIVSLIMLQTIWALGIGMIVLSLFIFLPKRLLLIIGLILIAGHDMLDNFHVAGNGMDAFGWSLLHDQRIFTFGNFNVLVGYPVIPWIGLMCTGYCFGELYLRFEGSQRNKILAALGISCILLFIALRWTNWYGDPSQWQSQKNGMFTLLSFINASKYPPSLLYILMTIGPAILFLAFAEKPLNKITGVIAVYGRVPMFYYILHIYLIHIAANAIALASGFPWDKVIHSNLFNALAGFGYRLWIVYIIWILVVALLYPLCKRYDAYKLNHKEKWWLSYL